LSVTPTDRGFVATTPHRVTFGPFKGSSAHAVRADLRKLLASLRPTEGETLHAVFGGAIPPNSDVENQLIYNVFDGASTVALSRGVRFELDDADAPAGAEYRYAVAPAGAPFKHWRESQDAARCGQGYRSWQAPQTTFCRVPGGDFGPRRWRSGTS